MTIAAPADSNLFNSIPEQLPLELIEELQHGKHVSIERIISRGHCTAPSQWLEQQRHEWVVVLQGSGKIAYQDGTEILLASGDFINIPAGTAHRVSWTDPQQDTIWLAIHYD